MDYEGLGAELRKLRWEKGWTQKEVADLLGVTDKAVSKWERGLGYPDVTYLPLLAEIFQVDLICLLQGDLGPGEQEGGNMKKLKYYVCPTCGGLHMCSGRAEVICCGRKLSPLEPKKAEEGERLTVEEVENDWFITGNCPMRKDDYISFVALATGEQLFVIRQYPEWDLQVRIPGRRHGMLLWYGEKQGLHYQLV